MKDDVNNKNELIKIQDNTAAIFKELQCLAHLLQATDKIEPYHTGGIIERYANEGLDNINKMAVIILETVNFS